MNTLQIHLNDNGFKQYFEHNWDKTYAAFRLESDTYPGLAAADGHYTKRQFIDLASAGREQLRRDYPRDRCTGAHTRLYALQTRNRQ